MPTRNVVLTDHQDDFVAGLVASGRYQNASEALRAGLRLLAEDEARMDVLMERLIRGHDQVVRGERAPGTGEEAARRAFQRARDAFAARQARNAAE